MLNFAAIVGAFVLTIGTIVGSLITYADFLEIPSGWLYPIYMVIYPILLIALYDGLRRYNSSEVWLSAKDKIDLTRRILFPLALITFPGVSVLISWSLGFFGWEAEQYWVYRLRLVSGLFLLALDAIWSFGFVPLWEKFIIWQHNRILAKQDLTLSP